VPLCTMRDWVTPPLVTVTMAPTALVFFPLPVRRTRFGDYKPTGKLSYSWPRSMAQLPINVGDARYDPLFPFGFGLTY